MTGLAAITVRVAAAAFSSDLALTVGAAAAGLPLRNDPFTRALAGLETAAFADAVDILADPRVGTGVFLAAEDDLGGDLAT
jgi:hypothetical protein